MGIGVHACVMPSFSLMTTDLLAMEFIRGQTLRDIKQNAAGVFGDSVLIQLGEIMALDAITNNRCVTIRVYTKVS